jgi:CHASE2 domain-containing sensor protein
VHRAQGVCETRRTLAQPIAILPETISGVRARSGSRLRIHWAWVPAAIFSVVVGLFRWGWLTTLALVLAGLLVAAYAEWRAARRRRA